MWELVVALTKEQWIYLFAYRWNIFFLISFFSFKIIKIENFLVTPQSNYNLTLFYIESTLQDVFVYKAPESGSGHLFFPLLKKSCFLKSALLVNFWIRWYSNILNLWNILMMLNKSIIRCSLVGFTI